MQQIDIQYFWPLTEQVALDLDYTPCKEYESKKREEMFSGSVLIAGGGVGVSTWGNATLAPTFEFKPEADSVGYWEVSKGLYVWRKQRPHWLHQKMTKVFFGWEWKDR